MDIYISDQLGACLAFFVLGSCSGLAYDILRTVRYIMIEGKGKSGKTAAFLVDLILDLVFMLALALSAVVLTFCYSYGKLRFFCTVSFVSAYVFYRVTFGRLYNCTVRLFILKLRSFVLRVISLTVIPIKYLLKLIRSFILWVYVASIGRLIRKFKRARIESHFLKELEGLEADVIF